MSGKTPISTPETESAFKSYGSALETKEAAKASLAMLGNALHYGQDLERSLESELKVVIAGIRHLLDSATEAVERLRTVRIEDRGYSAADRGVYSCVANPCGGDCGKCGKSP
jgi:hypothetical protein